MELVPSLLLTISDPSSALCSWSWSVKTSFLQFFSKLLQNGLAKGHPLREEWRGRLELALGCSLAMLPALLAHVSAPLQAQGKLGWGYQLAVKHRYQEME